MHDSQHSRTTRVILPAEIDAQYAYCARIKAHFGALAGPKPLAHIKTYGCQQNEADSERLRGYLAEMGCAFTEDAERAAVIVINTCAIREHAELRVLGNVGALTHTKRQNPNQIICLCGCMAQEAHVAQKIKESYRQVDLVFGPHALWRFPELLYRVCAEKGRVFEVTDEPGSIAEGVPVSRKDGVKAWVSIMYGCNNFCSYCIVPYVRGRERSRAPAAVLEEIRLLAEAGFQEITLLGQNVNSYGKDLDCGMDFATLLSAANDIPGAFLLRFMTSHPKDASQALFETMAKCTKVAPSLHLPFQAGNDRVLKAMNRGYTRENYLSQVRALRALIPDIALTSDVIVGFPGETAAEFEDTLTLLEEVRFDGLFTFIYSPRAGTPAAKLPDPMDKAEKSANFQRLVELQNRIIREKQETFVGKTLHCLVERVGEDPRNNLSARSDGNRLVHFNGDRALIGSCVTLKITSCSTWALFGELAETR